jgi:hypothetical protein
MRTIVLVAAALAALPLTSIRARRRAWCARDTRGGTNCGFHTYAQCQADIRGSRGNHDRDRHGGSAKRKLCGGDKRRLTKSPPPTR